MKETAEVRLIASSENWIEGAAVHQLKKTASLPGMQLAVGLPDLHPGKGSPIGAVFAVEGYTTDAACCADADRPRADLAARVIRAAAAGDEALMASDVGMKSKNIVMALAGHGSLTKLSFDLLIRGLDNAGKPIPRVILDGNADGAQLRFEVQEERQDTK